ncbi:hypothetical protein F5883DRAFT_403497, partial [Diaporthe sp. PMI_573]
FNLNLNMLTATHVYIMVYPFICIPNSIAAVSGSKFYIINQHYFIACKYPLF